MNKGYEVQVGHENRMDFDRYYPKWMAAEVGYCVLVTFIHHETLEGFVFRISSLAQSNFGLSG